MNIRAKARTTALIIISVLCALFLTACFDLGGYTQDSDVDVSNLSDHEFSLYYKPYFINYGSINLMKQDKGLNKYDLEKNFFNKQCVNEMRYWASNENCVEFNEYAYMTIKVQRKIKVDSLSLYVVGKDMEKEAKLEIALFVFDLDEDKDYATFDIWNAQLSENDSKEEEDKKKLSDYEDPKLEDAITTTKVTVNNTWNSFTVSFFEKGNELQRDPYEFNAGDTIVLMFINNMGYGLDKGLNKIKFSTTNLLIRKHPN